MKDKTTDYIKYLTEHDKKNLTQKALKVCEEAGELAKFVLPFENAHATTHRFVDRQRILEEVVDVYLTSISIAYDLDFTDDEIEEMIHQKSLKWGDLQRREDRLAEKFEPDMIPYEIHITVEEAEKDGFVEICNGLGVKPIILALQTSSNTIRDVMTSSVHIGNNRSAYEEMKRISQGLQSYCYNVVREKIETVPWHPAAPSSEHINPTMPPDCYFETHLGVIIEDDDDKKAIEVIAALHNAHLSRNVFKVHKDGSSTIMVTYRLYEGTYEEFEESMNKLKDDLEKHYTIEKTITEFSIYDTKVSHDAEWLKNES